MKKFYSRRRLFSLIALLVMMVVFQTEDFAQSCISEGVPVRTYMFLVTEDEGATFDTASIKNIRDGDTLTRPKFVGMENSTFKSWYLVEDPALFSDANKFDEGFFGTSQAVTVTDTVKLYASLKADVFHVIFMEDEDSDSRVFRVWERVAGTPNLNPDDEQVIVDEYTRSVGWYYDQAFAEQATTFTMPNHDIILYPKITTGKWVTYVSNGGTYVESDFYPIGETTQVPDNPTQVGYTFDGWNKDDEPWYRIDGSVNQFGGFLSESITLSAVWSPNNVNYTIVYWVENANDENYSVNNMRTATALAGTQITTLSSAYTTQNATNILDGLHQHVTTFSYDRNTQADATDVTVAGDGSTVINLYYKRKTYTLTFNPNLVYKTLPSFTGNEFPNGYETQENEVITAKYGANIVNHFPITRHYGFDSFLTQWTAESSMWKATNANVYAYPLQLISTMPGSDVTFYLYVNFSNGDQPKTIYYDFENLEGTGYDRIAVPTYFESITYGEQYYDVQGFSKLSEADAGFNTSTHQKDFNLAGEVTLQYLRNSHDIRFYNGGGELTALKQTRKYEQVIGTLPELSDSDAPAGMEGFSFGGWYSNELCEGDPIDITSTMPDADVFLYANWISQNYTVRIHHTTTGSGEYTDITVPYGGTVSGFELENVHPCAGETYAYGWKILNDDTSTSAFSPDMNIYRDLALVPFCLLTGEVYTITYNMNCSGATAVEDDHTYADGANPMVLSPSVDECAGNTFLGWIDADDAFHYPGNGIYMTENKTLTALWGPGTEYTKVVMIDNHPTTGKQTDSLDMVSNGTTQLNLPDNFERPGRPNDWFIGWTQNDNAQIAEFGPGESVALSCDATIYPVWMQITSNDISRFVCAGIDMDVNKLDVFSVSTDTFTHGTLDNIADTLWHITKDGIAFTNHVAGVITNPQPGTYVISPTLRTTRGEEKTFSNTITLNVVNEITPAFSSLKQNYCYGEDVGLPPTSDEGVTGTWTVNGDTVNKVKNTDVGTETYMFTPDAGQCAIVVSFDLTVNAKTVLSIGGYGEFCAGDSTVLHTITSDVVENYTWMQERSDEWEVIEGANQEDCTVKEYGKYKLVVTTSEGCVVTSSNEFEVTETPATVITFPYPDDLEQEITLGDEIIPIELQCENGAFDVNNLATTLPEGLSYETDFWHTLLTITGTPETLGLNEFTLSTLGDCDPLPTQTISITVTNNNTPSFTVTVTGNRDTLVYNGEEQSVSGYTLECSDPLYDESLVIFTGDDAKGTNVGTYPMNLASDQFSYNNENLNVTFDIISDGGLKVEAREVTVSVPDSTTDYNGVEQSGHSEYTFGNVLAGHTATIDYTPSKGTPASATPYDNGVYDASSFTVVDASNHNVTSNYMLGELTKGKLTINPNHDPITVTITGHQNTVGYNGSEQQVSGYDVAISGSTLYTEADFEFTGTENDSIAKGTNASSSIYGMNLSSSKFQNINSNFTNVEFVVANGFIRILPQNVTVTITCKETTKPYNGRKQSALDYEYTILPENTGFTFSMLQITSRDSASGVNVGTYEGVLLFDYLGSDENYEVIVVHRNICKLTITPVALTITAVDQTFPFSGSVQGPGDVVYSDPDDIAQYISIPPGDLKGGDYLSSIQVEGQSPSPAIGTYSGKLEPSHATFMTTLFEENGEVHPIPENYNINYVNGAIIIADPAGTPLTITASSDSKVYDGTPLTNDGYEFTTLATGDFIESVTVAGSQTVVGTCNNVPSEAVIKNAAGDVVTSDYDITYVNGTLEITPRTVNIGLTATKVYDGDTLKVTVPANLTNGTTDGWTISGLVDGEYFTSGTVKTESYRVGDYTCTDNQFLYMMAQAAEQSGFDISSGKANYTPVFNMSLSITKATLTITADGAEKYYDGSALTADGFTADGNASTDNVEAVTSGSQICAGEGTNTISSYVVRHSGDNAVVTDDYTVTTVDGTLKVKAITSGFACPGDVTVTLVEGTTDTNLTTVTTDSATLDPSVLGLPASVLSHITVKSNLASLNPMAVGTHPVTWTLYDDCDSAIATCTQNVTVQYEPCEGTITMASGHEYHYKSIGHQCWFTENLREEVGDHYAYNDETANFDKFGYLYSWYTAVNVPEGDINAVPTTSTADDGTEYVQGICPAGWAIPSAADVEVLNTSGFDVDMLKDPSTEYWLPGHEGSGGSGFKARAGGRYNSALDRYEDLMTGFHFWQSGAPTGTTSLYSACCAYYCATVLTYTPNLKGDRKSIRCIRKKAH